MKQTETIFKRIYSDTIFDELPNTGIGYDTKLSIAQLVHKRKVNGLKQAYMSKICGKSIATIKRFEVFKVDSLFLFNAYMHFLGDLPSKKRPGWI